MLPSTRISACEPVFAGDLDARFVVDPRLDHPAVARQQVGFAPERLRQDVGQLVVLGESHRLLDRFDGVLQVAGEDEGVSQPGVELGHDRR